MHLMAHVSVVFTGVSFFRSRVSLHVSNFSRCFHVWVYIRFFGTNYFRNLLSTKSSKERWYHSVLKRRAKGGWVMLSIRKFRALFKWLSKVVTGLRLLRLVIGLKDSRLFFSQWEAKPKPIAPCARDFSRASSELQVIARNCDWFIALPVPVVIGRSNCFGFGFSTVIWKPLSSTLVHNLVGSLVAEDCHFFFNSKLW